MTRPDPAAFLPGPGLNAYRPAPTVPAPPAPPRPVPLPEARLTIRPAPARVDAHRTGGLRPAATIVTPTKALLQAIPHLKHGAPVDVVPPARRGGTWYLDTRPTAPRRLSHRGSVARFSIPALSREHLLTAGVDARPGQFGGSIGTVGVRHALTFALGPELDQHPGYFALLPLRP